MCYLNILCGLKVLYWRKDNKADIKIKNLLMLVCIRMVFHICFATMTNFKIHITRSIKCIIFPFNLLSFIHGNSDTQVGWKVAKYFFPLWTRKIFRRKGNQPFWCLLIIFNSHKWTHRSTRVIHSNAQLSEFAIVKTSTDHNNIQTTYWSMARQIIHFAVFTCVNRPNHCGRHLGKINGHNSIYAKVWQCTFGRITQVLMGKWL